MTNVCKLSLYAPSVLTTYSHPTYSPQLHVGQPKNHGKKLVNSIKGHDCPMKHLISDAWRSVLIFGLQLSRKAFTGPGALSYAEMPNSIAHKLSLYFVLVNFDYYNK